MILLYIGLSIIKILPSAAVQIKKATLRGTLEPQILSILFTQIVLPRIMEWIRFIPKIYRARQREKKRKGFIQLHIFLTLKSQLNIQTDSNNS